MMQIIPRAKSDAIKSILTILPEPHYVDVSVFGLKKVKPMTIHGTETEGVVGSATRLKYPSTQEIFRLIKRREEIEAIKRKASIKVTGRQQAGFTDNEFKLLKKNPDWKRAEAMSKPNLFFKEAYFIFDKNHNAYAKLTEYGIDITLPINLKEEFLKKIANLPNKMDGLEIKITICRNYDF